MGGKIETGNPSFLIVKTHGFPVGYPLNQSIRSQKIARSWRTAGGETRLGDERETMVFLLILNVYL
jgi:hypothetical protein